MFDTEQDNELTGWLINEWFPTIAICLLVSRGRLAYSENQRKGRTMIDWAAEDTDLTRAELEAATKEAQSLTSDERAAIGMRVMGGFNA